MSYQLLRGDALALPLADESVDLVCTSRHEAAVRAKAEAQHALCEAAMEVP